MNAKITQGFWRERLEVNAQSAIFHQWDQLVASGCTENFRIAAGDVDGLRIGWFFADSDAYKWLDAASRIYASFPDPRLASLMDDYIALLARAQQPDGYIFTYNQIHFPGARWVNLQIEHELYCHGHLIEAGVSHHLATGRTDLLDIARRAANRIVEDFQGKGPEYTPGHEEIEIALLRLYRITQRQPYLEMARQFIEQRGRNPFFALSIYKQNLSVTARRKIIEQRKEEYAVAHPEYKPYQLPPGNISREPHNSQFRRQISALSGKYIQQHAPIRKQTVPVGHSVRFGYLETAVTMLARECNDRTLLPPLEQAWEHMVTRRMYVTGGIGAVPGLEGFGNDYELDPEYAYAETCAAIASIYWNWEMAQLIGEAKYSDLLEWQLYNAATVGMGLDGTTYLYNNPLLCDGGVTRKPWYAVPCCPSNISRTWADVGKYISSQTQDEIWIHQYISSQFETDLAKVEIESDVPWNGNVKIKFTPKAAGQFAIHLRLPSWSTRTEVNGQEIEAGSEPSNYEQTASGFDPRAAVFYTADREWSKENELNIQFDMPLQICRAHPKVKGHVGKVAITRGPLVYCLENVDNANVDIFKIGVNTNSLKPLFTKTALGKIVVLNGMSTDGDPLTLIPYFLWGNRGESKMTVWVNE
jgi:DUF1680 family protein